MPLTFKHRRPNIEMDFEFHKKDSALTGMDGTAHYNGKEYAVMVGRKIGDTPENSYGKLEIQQKEHDASQVEEVELYGDGYTYSCIPLPPELRSLDGDVVRIRDGTAALSSRMVKPWIYQDAEGNWPDSAPYSMLALQATLTTEQTDALFATLGIPSWEDVLAEQLNR